MTTLKVIIVRGGSSGLISRIVLSSLTRNQRYGLSVWPCDGMGGL